MYCRRVIWYIHIYTHITVLVVYNIHIKYTHHFGPVLFHTTQKNIEPPPPRLARASVKFPVCPGGLGLGGMTFLRDLQVELGRYFLGVCWGCFLFLSQELLKVFEGLILLGFITKCWIVLVRCYVLKDFTDTQTQWLWEAMQILVRNHISFDLFSSGCAHNMATHLDEIATNTYHLVDVRNSHLKQFPCVCLKHHLFKRAQR